MTEVALFTERREIVQVTDSAQIKERLMDTFEPSPRPRPRTLTTRQQLVMLAELAGPVAIEPEPSRS
jgi:hypothetical protein